jgi:hypothetical protein
LKKSKKKKRQFQIWAFLSWKVNILSINCIKSKSHLMWKWSALLMINKIRSKENNCQMKSIHNIGSNTIWFLWEQKQYITYMMISLPIPRYIIQVSTQTSYITYINWGTYHIYYDSTLAPVKYIIIDSISWKVLFISKHISHILSARNESW